MQRAQKKRIACVERGGISAALFIYDITDSTKVQRCNRTYAHYHSKIGCKITAFERYIQTFWTKNATILCKNATKNRLFSCVFQIFVVSLRQNFK